MTNVKLCRNGQRCNSVNYWVTRVQARPGRGQWSGHWWGLARGWHRPMGWPEWEDGWGARSWLVRLVAGYSDRDCVTLQLWAVSCGGPQSPLSLTQSLTREIPSPGPGDIGRCQTGRGEAKARCREWQWPGPAWAATSGWLWELRVVPTVRT